VYKINQEKSVAVLCTNNKQDEKESRKTILFTISSKTNKKALGINFTEKVKELSMRTINSAYNRETFTLVFIAALFTIVPLWKQLKLGAHQSMNVIYIYIYHIFFISLYIYMYYGVLISHKEEHEIMFAAK
jgi:hypothetical protein